MDSDVKVRRQLATWYHAQRRSLPWRDEPTPYRVWVSEIMLQQTRVAAVVPFFERFVDALPDVAALAAADESKVLTLWSGLGYYRRARHLHEAAKRMVDEHGAKVPSSAQALLTLPGIGRYTAGAISSIAFGRKEPVLDGNVSRVLARLYAIEDPIDTTATKHRLWREATRLVDPADPSSHNQALMELGALVCTPRQPRCTSCPLASHCGALKTDAVGSIPRKGAKRPPIPLFAMAALVLGEGPRVLLARRPPDGLLGGLWELPGQEVTSEDTGPQALRAAMAERLGLEVEVGNHLCTVEHVFTHRRLRLAVYEASPRGGDLAVHWYTDARWVHPDELGGLPLSRLTRKVLQATERAVG